jgi:predicted transcriptional regulator
MTDFAVINIRVNAALKAAVERIAKADGRTVSNLVKKLLADFVAAQPKGKAKP